MKRRRFDSDDDEDEIVVSSTAVDEALTEYAFTSAQSRDALRDMGLASSSASSERTPSEAPRSPLASQTQTSGIALPAEFQPAHAPALPPQLPRVETSCCAIDRDIPASLNGLLGDKLLSVYSVPLEYVTSEQPMNDKLLSQYLPFRDTPTTSRTLAALADEEADGPPANRFGIRPGWRWDGVMRGTPFTREEETRMHALEKRLDGGDTLTPDEQVELATLKSRYHWFLGEGERVLREGAAQKRASAEKEKAVATSSATVADSFDKVGKALYFWGSLAATAVPGYLGRKAGVTTDFLHWNFITDHIVLGALPVVTQVGSSGGHMNQIRDQLNERHKKLGMVVACLETEEMDGYGVSPVQFAKEKDWRDALNPELVYVQLSMPDTTARIEVPQVADAVDKMQACIRTRDEVVYVHCKAGKGRSWMVVMCYLTTCGGLSYDQAVALIQQQRGQVSPSTAQESFAREFPIRYAEWKSLQDAPPQSS